MPYKQDYLHTANSNKLFLGSSDLLPCCNRI